MCLLNIKHLDNQKTWETSPSSSTYLSISNWKFKIYFYLHTYLHCSASFYITLVLCMIWCIWCMDMEYGRYNKNWQCSIFLIDRLKKYLHCCIQKLHCKTNAKKYISFNFCKKLDGHLIWFKLPCSEEIRNTRLRSRYRSISA